MLVRCALILLCFDDAVDMHPERHLVCEKNPTSTVQRFGWRSLEPRLSTTSLTEVDRLISWYCFLPQASFR